MDNPYKRGKFGHRNRYVEEEYHVKMKAEISMTFLQDRGFHRLCATDQKLREAWNRFSVLKRNQLCCYWALDFPLIFSLLNN